MNRHSIINFIYNYDSFFRNNNIDYRKMIQQGGSSITMEYKDEIFTFDISEDNDFFFLRTHDGKNDSITFAIDKKSKTVNINNINADNIQPCFQKITNKKGTYLLKIGIKFAKKLKNEKIIDVNRITLTDHSIKYCSEQKNKRVIFSDLRQIISGDTFYGKHGFIPVHKRNIENYNKNKTILMKLILKDINFEKYLIEFNKKNDISENSLNLFIKFIKDNETMKLGHFFEILSESFETNCNLIDFLIKRIYRKYNLETMYGTIYEMLL